MYLNPCIPNPRIHHQLHPQPPLQFCPVFSSPLLSAPVVCPQPYLSSICLSVRRRRQRGVATTDGGRGRTTAGRRAGGRARAEESAPGERRRCPGGGGGRQTRRTRRIKGEGRACSVAGQTLPGEERKEDCFSKPELGSIVVIVITEFAFFNPIPFPTAVHHYIKSAKGEKENNSFVLCSCLCFDRGESEVKHCPLHGAPAYHRSNSCTSYLDDCESDCCCGRGG